MGLGSLHKKNGVNQHIIIIIMDNVSLLRGKTVSRNELLW